MPTLTVKNIPEDLYQRLKQSASANRRSLNSEIIVCIERTLKSRPVAAAQLNKILATARALRKKTEGHELTDDQFSRAKTAGRR